MDGKGALAMKPGYVYVVPEPWTLEVIARGLGRKMESSGTPESYGSAVTCATQSKLPGFDLEAIVAKQSHNRVHDEVFSVLKSVLGL